MNTPAPVRTNAVALVVIGTCAAAGVACKLYDLYLWAASRRPLADA